MKTIGLSGIVGWDITADDLREQMEAAGGESIRFEINSPGGSVFDGIEIYNMIRNYTGETETRIISLGASMGSIIALAGDKVTAEDSAVYMIHNPTVVSWGDYQDLQKTAEFLENLTSHLARIYTQNSNFSLDEILTMMQNETWLFGEEMAKFGIEIIPSEEKKDEAEALQAARVSFMSCQDKLSKEQPAGEKIDKIAAMIQPGMVNGTSGVKLSPEVRREIARNKGLHSDNSGVNSVSAGAQMPGDTAPTVDRRTKGEKAIDEAVDKLLGKKKDNCSPISKAQQTVDNAIDQRLGFKR